MYESAINKLARNILAWQTGNTTVDLENTRMKAFDALKQYYKESFVQGAKERKMAINRSMAWSYM
jgi:hypothetical protein